MANDKDFKVKSGIAPAVYHESVGSSTDGAVTGSLLATPILFNTTGAPLYSPGAFKSFQIANSGSDFISTSDESRVVNFAINSYNTVGIDTTNSSSLIDSQEDLARCVRVKPDGTKLYLMGATNEDIFQYSLSTAYDVSTDTYDSKSFSLNGEDPAPQSFFFKPDGTKMYMIGSSTPRVFQYSLSTAWDISTASYDSVSFNVSALASTPRDVVFTSDGETMFVLNDATSSEGVYKYTLTTGWDLSTAGSGASYLSLDLATNRCMWIDDSDSKLYVGGTTGVYQYDIKNTSTVIDQSSASVNRPLLDRAKVISFSNPASSGSVVSSKVILSPQGTFGGATSDAVTADLGTLSSKSSDVQAVEWKPDGTKLFAVFDGGDNDVAEYSLSTAWDLSTISYVGATDVGSEDANPVGVTFKSDGSKMYVVGQFNDNIYQYTLSTPWSITTESYDSVSVSTPIATVEDLTFNNDGTQLLAFNLGSGFYYSNLSTAWDLSTLGTWTFLSNKGHGDDISAGKFSLDGNYLYLTDQELNNVTKHALSTAWDASTIEANPSFGLYVSGTSALFENCTVNDDLSKLYICNNSIITQYSFGDVGAAWDSSINWSGGTAPTLPSVGETSILEVTTRDGGTTYHGVTIIDGAV